MKSTEIQAVLQIDHDRGVIYVHLSEQKEIQERGIHTALRISGLPSPIPELKDGRMLDMAVRPSSEVIPNVEDLEVLQFFCDWIQR